jgi:hypothetical protein
MAFIRSTVAGREVLGTGNCIANQGDVIELFPFDGSTYKVSLEYSVQKSGEASKIRTEVVNAAHVKLIIKDSIDGQWLGTSSPIIVATHLGKNVYVSLAGIVMGSEERHTILISYQFSTGDAG